MHSSFIINVQERESILGISPSKAYYSWCHCLGVCPWWLPLHEEASMFCILLIARRIQHPGLLKCKRKLLPEFYQVIRCRLSEYSSIFQREQSICQVLYLLPAQDTTGTYCFLLKYNHRVKRTFELARPKMRI